MSPKKEGVTFLAVIFILFILSVGAAYHRYMVQQDFVYFSTEDQIPDQFSLSAYPQL
jgi:hypothetical protein